MWAQLIPACWYYSWLWLSFCIFFLILLWLSLGILYLKLLWLSLGILYLILLWFSFCILYLILLWPRLLDYSQSWETREQRKTSSQTFPQKVWIFLKNLIELNHFIGRYGNIKQTSWGWAGPSSVPAYLAMPDRPTVFI